MKLAYLSDIFGKLSDLNLHLQVRAAASSAADHIRFH